ncbi:uncharacterized protein LOC110451467 [Mizuhopecten yessoensis]|uniref:uncharacterized protein LOC110451467 n=1 Tax=Mizuhopecten yessoensis TaxID=6573 RepID=UPI000B45D4B7|nr:uncharacterized protein LOC110451467 [Mizuhopecten yessoensis]
MAAAISGGQEAVRQKGSTKCPNHLLKDVVYVCKDCQILMCTTCSIKSVHRTHNLEELSVFAQEKKTAMLDFVNLSEKNTIPHLKDDLIAKEHLMSETSSEFKKVSSNMKLQGEKCKQEIDELIAGFTSTCDEMERSNLELLRHQKKDKQHRYDVVLAAVEECKKALQTSTDVEIFYTDFDTLGSYTDTNPPVLQTCQYTPCTTITDHLKQAIGKFTTGSDVHSQTQAAATSTIGTLDQCQESSAGHTDIEKAGTRAENSPDHPPSYELLDNSIIISQFPVSAVALSMCTTPEGNLWILDASGKTVLQMNDKGETKQKIELHSDIIDICVSPETGRLWFGCKDRTIYELQEPATPVPKFDTKDKPSCLSITSDGVIVGTTNSLTIHTASGSVLHTITNEEQPDFVPPLRISNCLVTRNIAVIHISCTSFPYNSTMHIAVYDSTLNHLVTYRGDGIRGQELATPETFGPFSVDYDSFGNLIIADVKRKTIELLSGTGQYLRTLHSGAEDKGAICIGSENTLWSQMRDDEGHCTIKILKYCKCDSNTFFSCK